MTKFNIWFRNHTPKKLYLRVKTHDFNPEIAVISLINKHFWKSKIGPISSIVLPVMFMLMYKIMSIGTSNGVFALSLATYITLSVLPLTLITLPQVICEFKTSIILRKISVSTITKFRFTFILLTYYFIALICSSLGVIVLYATFLATAAPAYFSMYNWGEFVYALLNLYIAALFSGLLLGVLLKRAGLVQVIGICILLLSMMLAGQLMPLTVLGQSETAKIVSLFSPLTYPMALINTVLALPDTEIVNNIFKELPPGVNIPSDITSIIAKSTDEFKRLYGLIPGASNIFSLDPFFVINITISPIEVVNKQVSVLTGVQQINIYESWHKVLNLLMPWIIAITFGVISMKLFKWTSR